MILENPKNQIIELFNVPTRTRQEFRSGTGSGGIWAGSGSGPVPVDLAVLDRYRNFFQSTIIKPADSAFWVSWGYGS